MSADAKHHTSCVSIYLLLEYGKIGNESKDATVPHGVSDISVTMNVYTHIGFDDAEEELKWMEEFRKAQTEIEKRKKRQCYRRRLKQFNMEED